MSYVLTFIVGTIVGLIAIILFAGATLTKQDRQIEQLLQYQERKNQVDSWTTELKPESATTRTYN